VGVLLWEALAGRHPFWESSLLETARAIESGAPPLATVRPDLPRALLAAVDRALDLDPAGRPSAAALAQALQVGGKRRRRHRRRDRVVVPPIVLARVAPALLAGVFSAWTAFAFPFYPSGWPIALALLSTAVTFLRPRIGLLLALAVPVFPLGNLALGVALLYVLVAVALLVLSWREPESGLLGAVGPLLAPLSALALLPLLTLGTRSAARRAAQAGAAVLAAAIVAGVRHAPLPFDSRSAPHELGLAGSRSVTATASVLWHALLSRPALLVEALVLAAAAGLLPHARERGLWAVAGLGAAVLAGALLPVPEVAAIPLVVSVWATCAVVALR
jgi:hypothetical protein